MGLLLVHDRALRHVLLHISESLSCFISGLCSCNQAVIGEWYRAHISSEFSIAEAIEIGQ